MACVHNQAIINGLQAQMETNAANMEILWNNYEKAHKIQEKHDAFVTQLNCVIDNLQNNYVFAGQPYDGGDMTVCRDNAQATVDNCEEVIKQSLNKRKELDAENRRLSAQINSLQGDCAQCEAQKATSAYWSSAAKR